MLNNRELATLIWLGVLLLYAVTQSGVRSSLSALVRTLVHWKILVPLLLLVANTLAAIAVGARVKLWTSALIPDSVYWFFGSALVLFLNLDRSARESHFFRSVIAGTLGLTVALEVFMNLAVLGLPWELGLQPVLFLLTGVSVVAATKPEFEPARKLVAWLLGLLGLMLAVYVVSHVISHWSAFDQLGTARQLALPFWLTLAVLPLIYVLSLISQYEMTFLRLDWHGEKDARKWRIKLALFLTLRGRVRAVGGLSGQWLPRLATANSFGSAREIALEYKRSLR